MIHISQEVNDKVDELARLATSPKPGQLKMFILHSVPEPSVLEKECLQVEENPSGWKNEIVKYLKHKTLPTDKGKAKKLRTQAARYTLVAGKLYRRGFPSHLLKYLDQDQANYLL